MQTNWLLLNKWAYSCNERLKQWEFWLEEKFSIKNFSNPKNLLNKGLELVLKYHYETKYMFCNLVWFGLVWFGLWYLNFHELFNAKATFAEEQ